MALLITIIGFGIMVFLHELGHFLVAKKFGVLVHEFAIGMGPKIFSFGKGETKYSLRLLPIGGFVQLEGENDLEENNDPRSFSNLKPIKRIAILVAGAVMNLILGWLIFIFLNMNTGITPSVVKDISEEYKAVQTFLMPGDRIVRMDNTRIHTFDDVALFMSRTDGDPIKITVKRDGKKVTDEFAPQKTQYGYILGAVFGAEKCNIFKAAQYAVYDALYISKAVIFALADLVTGRVGINALSGPVEIVSVVGEVTQQKSPFTYLMILSLFAMITVNLGVFNLLPFPALDGGSIVFALYELVTRRKVKPEVIGYFSMVGFALLMILAAVVTVGDVRDWINK